MNLLRKVAICRETAYGKSGTKCLSWRHRSDASLSWRRNICYGTPGRYRNPPEFIMSFWLVSPFSSRREQFSVIEHLNNVFAMLELDDLLVDTVEMTPKTLASLMRRVKRFYGSRGDNGFYGRNLWGARFKKNSGLKDGEIVLNSEPKYGTRILAFLVGWATVSIIQFRK